MTPRSIPTETAPPRFTPQNDNVSQVYAALGRHGPHSRVDLARRLGLSQTSVSRIAERLLQAQLIVEGDRVSSGTGRPQTLLHQNAAAAAVAGVSVRSRFVRVHLADLHGTLLTRAQHERADDAPALIEQVADLVQALRDAAMPGTPLAGVSVGISGVWNADRQQVLAAPNLRALEGTDVAARLSESLATRGESAAVNVDNDINLAALGERAHGAAQDVDDFFYLNLGSGVGGAAVVRGRVQRGAQGFAGEVGYLPVALDGEVRALEAWVGRAALERRAVELGASAGHDNVFDMLAADEAEDGILSDFVSRALGQALVAVVTTLNPQRIVLGGALGRHGSHWTSRIRTHLGRFVPLVPEVVPTAIGPEASLLGAIEHARDAARTIVLDRVRTA